MNASSLVSCCWMISVGSALDDVEAHLTGVGGLDLALNAVQLPPEPVLGAGVQHLAPGPRSVRRPNTCFYGYIRRSKLMLRDMT
jgi:hypothetical protein